MASASLTRFGAPWPNVDASGGGSFATFPIDATTDKLGIVVQAPAAATVTKINFRHNQKTGSPGSYRVSLQSLDANGLPSGTILGGGSPASATFAIDGTYSFGTFHRITLTNSLAVTRGQVFAIVIDYASGTVDASNFSQFTYGWSLNSPRIGFPYCVTNTGTWAKDTVQLPAGIGYESASVVYGWPMMSLDTTDNVSTTTESGITFTLPAGWGATYDVAGLRALMDTIAAGGTVTFSLYSGALSTNPTLLQQVQLDSDVVAVPGNSYRDIQHYFDEATLSTLSHGTKYALGISASSSVGLHSMTVAAAGDWEAWPFGQNAAFCSRTISAYPPTSTGAAFTETATKRPYLDIIFNDFTEPAGGGGGGLLRANMAGGVY